MSMSMSRGLLVLYFIVTVDCFEVENARHRFLFDLAGDVLFHCWIDDDCLLVRWDVVRWLYRLPITSFQRRHHVVIIHVLVANMTFLTDKLSPCSHIASFLRVCSPSSASWWLLLIRFVRTLSYLTLLDAFRPVVWLIRLSTEHFVEFVIQITGAHRVFPVLLLSMSKLVLAVVRITVLVFRDLVCVGCGFLSLNSLLCMRLHGFSDLVTF